MSEKIKLRIGIILLIASIVLLSSCGTKNINDMKTIETSSSSSEFGGNDNTDSSGTAISRKFGAKKSTIASENTKSEKNDGSTDTQSSNSYNEHGKNYDGTSAENNAYETTYSNTEENFSVSNDSEQITPPEAHSSTCSFTIDCKNAIASNKLSETMRDILPNDGIIYKSQNLDFIPDETVFDILLRITRQNGIPMEFSMTPAFGSKYIEGINSLREFDCGETSGWKYSVNGEVPNCGCDKYTVKPDDDIIFYYVTDWGGDI